jgi:hypothetical protein
MDTDMSVLAYIWSFVGLVLVAESVFSSRRPAFGRRMVDNTFARRNPVDINLTGQDYQVHQVHQAQKPFVILPQKPSTQSDKKGQIVSFYA